MIKFDEWWFPDGETSLPEQMTKVGTRIVDRNGVQRLTYQYHKYAVCLDLMHATARPPIVAVDVGAHIGLWSYWMTRDFVLVHAFEPFHLNYECLYENLRGVRNLTISQTALGATPGQRSLVVPVGASGGVHLSPDVQTTDGSTIDVARLDDYDIPHCSLLKIDVEGQELDVVRGATKFLTRTKPILILETIPANAARYNYDVMDAVHAVEALGGYVHVRMGHHDLIMGWR